MSHPLVVHCRRARYDTFVGRPSLYGNPWVVGPDGTRDEVIDRYETWLRTGRDFGHPKATAERREEILRRLPELKGKTLGCFCAPRRCHSEVLVALAEGG